MRKKITHLREFIQLLYLSYRFQESGKVFDFVSLFLILVWYYLYLKSLNLVMNHLSENSWWCFAISLNILVLQSSLLLSLLFWVRSWSIEGTKLLLCFKVILVIKIKDLKSCLNWKIEHKVLYWKSVTNHSNLVNKI